MRALPTGSEPASKDAALFAALLAKHPHLTRWALVDDGRLGQTAGEAEQELVGWSPTQTKTTLAAGVRAIGLAASRGEVAPTHDAHPLLVCRRAIVTQRVLSVRLRWWLATAHRRASKWQAVCVLNEAIQDGISQRWVTSGQGRMPGFNRQLADDQRRADLAAVVDDLEQVFGLDDAGWREEEVIEHEQPDASELPKTADVASVATAERQLG
jgi:hypothetical protein